MFKENSSLSENSSREERYAALSEIYLAKALDVGRSSQCNATLKSNSCVEQELALFDKSLRYSYVYLFDSEESPFDRVFDHRQNQVRIFYNVALSKLMTTYFNHLNTLHFPPLLKVDGHEYHVNFDHAVDVQHIEVDTFRSSYNMNFSGFNTVNRKDGLGAEFIVGRKEHDVNHGFILDPDAFMLTRVIPTFIYHVSFQSRLLLTQNKRPQPIRSLMGQS